MEHYYEEYLFSNDKSKMQISQVADLLKKTYWAANRQIDTIKTSMENSICYGIFDSQNIQIGFARVITDHATTYYICDVVVEEKHRSQGLGKELLHFITQDEEFKSLMGLLLTRDAHDLYQKYGFAKDPKSLMVKRRSKSAPII